MSDLPPRPSVAAVEDALTWAELKSHSLLFSENFEGHLRAEILHLRARVAELETERDTVMTTLGVVDEGKRVVSAASFVRQACDAFAARVAELEAQQGEPTGTEWAVRYDGMTEGVLSAPARNSEQVNRQLAERNGGTLMVRDTFAPGPWRAAQ